MKPGYVIHLNLGTFRAQATTDLRIERFIETESVGMRKTAVTSHLMVAGRDDTGIIHAGRLVVDRISLIVADTQAAERRISAHTETAYALLTSALGGVTQGGLLLMPGLWEDLNRFYCSHDLWRWEGKDDKRRLVPTTT
ncbi:MAG TPA: hypothetical protein VFS21_30675 [Roseiflexaceae bacterium]|nr:hypothetical protein [Roseiflexaceae bacterium]